MKKSTLKFLAVLAIVSMVVMMGLPALAKGGKGKGKGQGQGRGGKKAVGTVVAYEPASNLLTASMKDGSTFSGTVAEDVKVKLDHRGNNGENKRKKPSNGDETNIVPNAEILKMKVKCDEVTKLRLRAATAVPLDDAAEVEEPVVEEPADETDHEEETDLEEPAADEPADETDGGIVDDLTNPLARTMTEDEGDDSDDCADETEDETDEDDSDDLDEDLDGELDEADDADSADDSADDADDSADDSSADDGLDDTVECVVTELVDCL